MEDCLVILIINKIILFSNSQKPKLSSQDAIVHKPQLNGIVRRGRFVFTMDGSVDRSPQIQNTQHVIQRRSNEICFKKLHFKYYLCKIFNIQRLKYLLAIELQFYLHLFTFYITTNCWKQRNRVESLFVAIKRTIAIIIVFQGQFKIVLLLFFQTTVYRLRANGRGEIGEKLKIVG